MAGEEVKYAAIKEGNEAQRNYECVSKKCVHGWISRATT